MMYPASIASTARTSQAHTGSTLYEICFRKADGSLARKISTACESELKAKILAHALREAGTAQLEVWAGETLVYARGEQSGWLRRH